MSINPISTSPVLVQVEKLSTKQNNIKPAKEYINPNFIVKLDSANKKERLSQSYAMDNNSALNETKITLYNGEHLYVDGDIDSVAKSLNNASSKLDITA